MNSQNLNFYIQVRFKLGLAINEIIKELKTALPERHPSLAAVTFLSSQLKRGVEAETSRWVPMNLTNKIVRTVFECVYKNLPDLKRFM